MTALPVSALPVPAADDLVEVRTAAGPAVAVPAVLELAAPLPGLPGHEALLLEPLDDTGVLFALRSVPGAASELRLFVVAPGAFFPGYGPDVTGVVDGLAAGAGADPVLLVVVHPVDDAHETPTANLLAPLVVDPTTGRAVQTVLEGDWPLRARLG
ncbi:flagellar assembly protein FliW [Cellulomonas endophytica]|uniref:flagellar assembly protein FliW n=1 Tax=Cellulomonas endophytica TaxID=2494735 RepID=UPI001011B092|nr:flagellar assembly protein FliW [Cellulomonas endophytica]